MAKPANPFQRGDVTMYDSSLGWRFPNRRMGELYSLINNGETAENVAEKYQISRQDQDEVALGSHQKALKAYEDGRLKDEIIPFEIPQKKGAPIVHSKDEGPRADTSLEKLAALQPSFKKGGTVTAGNSSPLSDGAFPRCRSAAAAMVWRPCASASARASPPSSSDSTRTSLAERSPPAFFDRCRGGTIEKILAMPLISPVG